MSWADKRFGKLTILKQIRSDIFICMCDCGNKVEVWRSQLANSVKRHCGCRTSERSRSRNKGNGGGWAGHTRYYKTGSGNWRCRTSDEFNSYKAMKERCFKVTGPYYDLYGGRGIRVCLRWLLPCGEGFRNFLADLGPRPTCQTLDRINPNGHYEPTNCRWATAKVQRENQGRVIWAHCEPPSVEDYREMEARIAEEMEELMPY